MSKKKKKKQPKKKVKGIKQLANKFADENRKMPTPAEKYFKKLLMKAGIRFKSEKMIPKPPSFILVDFYIPDRKLCIELDGGYHNTPEKKAKDIERDAYLVARGYINWRMTNEEALALTKEDVIAKIKPLTPKQTKIRILAYQEPRPSIPQPVRKKGNPRSKRHKKSKPIKTDYPILDQIAANKAQRENRNKL